MSRVPVPFLALAATLALFAQTAKDAPPAAVTAYEQGMAAAKSGQSEAAVKSFQEATSLYPQYADAWYQLGRAQLAGKSKNAAVASFKKAVELDPKLAGAQVELGLLAVDNKSWSESSKYLEKAIELDPVNYPAAWYAAALANLNLENFDLAEKYAREALKADPQLTNPRIEYVLGMVLAQKKDYPGAITALRSYLKRTSNGFETERLENMIAELESSKK